MTKLSNSQVMETRICELVKEYLDYMQRDRNGYGNGRNAFLVITIDDVDMHFQKEGSSPYEMLETLHRYLMIPGVIIMLSYNYLDLYQGCEKHFYELFHKSQKMGDHAGDSGRLLCKKIVLYLSFLSSKGGGSLSTLHECG